MPLLDLSCGAIEYRVVEGDTAKEPLVFLHEGLGCVATWSSFPDQVAAATGRAALIYSRSGYGGSGPLTSPRTVDYLHVEAEVVLPELLDRLSLRRPLLVGHSEGASIALIHASRFPVSGLVAIAPHVFVEPEALRGITAARDWFDHGELARQLAYFHDDPAETFRSWAGIWLSAEFASWTIEDRLGRVECPILLIQGEQDRYGTMRQLDVTAGKVAGPVRRLELPDCGHVPYRERPELTLAAVIAFIRDSLAGSALLS